MNTIALLPIHPVHADSILSGGKLFEYRKRVPVRKISHIALYCTTPIKKIKGIVEVTEYIEGSPSHVWELTSFGAGIRRHLYNSYFRGCLKAYSFKLGRVYELPNPIELFILSSCKKPPQSFCYLNPYDSQLFQEYIDHAFSTRDI
jgi:predicted transcriptional regulator